METYSPTPNEWRVKPRVNISSPPSDRVLGGSKLDTPCEDVNAGDEVDQATNPTMQSRKLVERELGGVWKSEKGEGSGFERE